MKASRLIAALTLALCFGAALAGGRGAVRKQIESTLLATGTVDIETDGSVSGYVLDRGGELPKVAFELLDRATRVWNFEPILVAGKPVRARTTMSIRLVATRAGDGDGVEVRIASGNFGKLDVEGAISSVSLPPPQYPMDAARAGVRGTVYVLVRVGRDGSVEDAVAEQVNLKVIDTEVGMDRWRQMLAKAALRASGAWTFSPPTRGDEVDAPFWIVRVPVDFVLADEKSPRYGQWVAYVPGPRQRAPWLGDIDTSLGADAVAAGSIQPLGTGPKLLTPIGG
ncbi:energy transducer TonB [Lysobacter sp. S4-A87]|uniref:energy transducer TonB n=1 Tax=Lysobacter sp. S4-A87 TaxID=2925843 RepID=UPI001F538DC5|nr:energy transducer TonB [Lysobacter sp. S4-A87]UNK48471.1 energy transducer TonB [Lysobacter sp. S4-A87]